MLKEIYGEIEGGRVLDVATGSGTSVGELK